MATMILFKQGLFIGLSVMDFYRSISRTIPTADPFPELFYSLSLILNIFYNNMADLILAKIQSLLIYIYIYIYVRIQQYVSIYIITLTFVCTFKHKQYTHTNRDM